MSKQHTTHTHPLSERPCVCTVYLTGRGAYTQTPLPVGHGVCSTICRVQGWPSFTVAARSPSTLAVYSWIATVYSPRDCHCLPLNHSGNPGVNVSYREG